MLFYNNFLGYSIFLGAFFTTINMKDQALFNIGF